MLGSLKEEKVLDLVNEALLQVSRLSGSGVTEIISVLKKTRDVLTSPVSADRDVPLVLSAARWRVADVEKYTVKRIVHDEVDGPTMSILVHVRLVCAEVLRILDRALDDLRQSRIQSPRPLFRH